jgi:predicted DNA-binding transcriptional regulator YafY
VSEEIWRAAARALRECRQLRVAYRAPGFPQASTAVVDPIHLACRLGDWYLIAWRTDGSRPGERVYALSRVKEAVVLSAAAGRHEFNRGRDAAERFGRFIPGFGERGRLPLKVKIRFAPRVAEFALERSWHPDQRAQTHRDGSATLTLPIPGFDEALAWVLRWGSAAEVLSPPELRARAAEESRGMAKAYRKKP